MSEKSGVINAASCQTYAVWIANHAVAMGVRRVERDFPRVRIALIAAAADANNVELVEVSVPGSGDERRPIALRVHCHEAAGWPGSIAQCRKTRRIDRPPSHAAPRRERWRRPGSA